MCPGATTWFKGWNNDGKKIPPADFTAVEGWGQVYQEDWRRSVFKSDVVHRSRKCQDGMSLPEGRRLDVGAGPNRNRRSSAVISCQVSRTMPATP